MRNADQLLSSALAAIDMAYNLPHVKKQCSSSVKMFPLFSGGHDSLCAVYCAAQHFRFTGAVYHIDTGIGSIATRAFVERVCKEEGWRLQVYKNKYETYETIVRRFGFPGVAMHHIAYNYLKERCLLRMTKKPFGGSYLSILISGTRRQESKRRAKNTTAVRYSDKSFKHGLWVSPCHDWSSEEQKGFMDEIGLNRNPVKMSPLGMSGECFCGAFARPNELEMIRQVCPDVAEKIDKLTEIAKASGKNCEWGKTPEKGKQLQVLPTGPMCSSCDVRAKAAGILIQDEEES